MWNRKQELKNKIIKEYKKKHPNKIVPTINIVELKTIYLVSFNKSLSHSIKK